MKKLRTGAGVDKEALVASCTLAGVERIHLSAAQRVCPDFAVYYACKLAEETGNDPRATLVGLKSKEPLWFVRRKIDSILTTSSHYELVRGVLFRRVWDETEGEVQLRCCVPDRPWGQFEVPGQGLKTFGYRERLLLEYHNGSLAGHQGRERTAAMLARDFYWPGLYSAVCSWCKTCQIC